MKNRDVADVRVIDMLVIKGQMELKEITMQWKQKCHIMVSPIRTNEISYNKI